MNSATQEKQQVLGCSFNATTFNEAVDTCLMWAKDPSGSRIVSTVNAALIVMQNKDADLRHACEASDMVVADGVPVVWASRLVSSPLPERVAGVELMQRLLETGGEHNLRVYFFGAQPVVLERLGQICRERYPALTVCGMRNGYFDEKEQMNIITNIRDSQPDILFIGMPSPFKEVWAQEHRDELGAHLILGVGGSFDVIAGFVRRAPRWMRACGLEWFWRLLMEPRKMWKRYLVTNTLFIGRLLKDMACRTGRDRTKTDRTTDNPPPSENRP